jgi:hypothetical protein
MTMINIPNLDEMMAKTGGETSTAYKTRVPANVPLLVVADSIEAKWNESKGSYGLLLTVIVCLDEEAAATGVWNANAKTEKSTNYMYLGKRYSEDGEIDYLRDDDGNISGLVNNVFVTLAAFGLGQHGNDVSAKTIGGRMAKAIFKHEEYNGNLNARILSVEAIGEGEDIAPRQNIAQLSPETVAAIGGTSVDDILGSI